MKLARRHSEEPHINLTSLIDVVFLLLIFFMVTTTFVRHAGLPLRLPEAGSATVEPSETVVATVDAADRIYLAGERVGAEALPEKLRAAMADGAGTLRIQADGRASHQAVVRVMDAAAALNVSRVDLATRPEEETATP